MPISSIESAVYRENPLPSFKKLQVSTEPLAKPNEDFIAPWFVLSLLHSSRDGRPGWSEELERLDIITEAEFDSLADELTATAKSSALKAEVQAWADQLRARRDQTATPLASPDAPQEAIAA